MVEFLSLELILFVEQELPARVASGGFVWGTVICEEIEIVVKSVVFSVGTGRGGK